MTSARNHRHLDSTSPSVLSEVWVGVVSVITGNAKASRGSLKTLNSLPQRRCSTLLRRGSSCRGSGFRFGSNVVLLYVCRCCAYERWLCLARDRPEYPTDRHPRHDTHALWTAGCARQPAERDGGVATNPARCTDEPLTARIEADSWEEPTRWISAGNRRPSRVSKAVTCSSSIPTSGSARNHTRSRHRFRLQETDLKGSRDAAAWPVLQIPAAEGTPRSRYLSACRSRPRRRMDWRAALRAARRASTFPHGTAHPDEAGEGEALGSNGVSYLTSGHCPSNRRSANLK